MVISDFVYHTPHSLHEACQILANCSNAALLAGGTDLLVEIKQGLRQPHDIISLGQIQELKQIVVEDNHICIGAAVTHNEIANSKIVREIWPSIAEAALQIGSEQIRNVGTIGGNLCTGASCCDMGPLLMALDVSLEIFSSTGRRMVSIRDFFLEHKKTRLKNNEILLNIVIDKPETGTGAFYEKFGLREAASISVASVAAVLHVKHGICKDVCIVIGAVAPTPKISEKANKLVKDCKVSELVKNSPLLNRIGKAVSNDSLPIDDIRGSANYRRDIIKSLSQRAVLNALDAIII